MGQEGREDEVRKICDPVATVMPDALEFNLKIAEVFAGVRQVQCGSNSGRPASDWVLPTVHRACHPTLSRRRRAA